MTGSSLPPAVEPFGAPEDAPFRPPDLPIRRNLAEALAGVVEGEARADGAVLTAPLPPVAVLTPPLPPVAVPTPPLPPVAVPTPPLPPVGVSWELRPWQPSDDDILPVRTARGFRRRR